MSGDRLYGLAVIAFAAWLFLRKRDAETQIAETTGTITIEAEPNPTVDGSAALTGGTDLVDLLQGNTDAILTGFGIDTGAPPTVDDAVAAGFVCERQPDGKVKCIGDDLEGV